MGKPVELTITRTVYSCVSHAAPTAGCPWCWVMNQRLDGPSPWKVT